MGAYLLQIFHKLPEDIKYQATMAYIYIRKMREKIATLKMQASQTPTKELPVVYVSGMHRSGTSLCKAYFGDYPKFEYWLFDPSGFFKIWNASYYTSRTIIDKSNHYIENVDLIFKATKGRAAFCFIVRDPRDTLLSLCNWSESRNIPRTEEFWLNHWTRVYQNYLDFAAQNKFLSPRCYLIRYEDLVRWPCAAKRDFLVWAGIPLVEDILPSYKIIEEDLGLEPKAKSCSSINDSSVGKWKSVSEPNLKSLINSWKRFPETISLMKKLGYNENGCIEVEESFSGLRFFKPQNVTTRSSTL